MTVLVLNGPNLRRLGTREPGIYGATTFAELTETLHAAAADLGLTVDVRQTDDEAELVGWLHEAADTGADVVLNPAAFTHYSYSLRDACAQVPGRLIEVHLSNPAAREEFRQHSYLSDLASGILIGFGTHGYHLAMNAVIHRLTGG